MLLYLAELRIVDNDPQLLDRLQAERVQQVSKLDAAKSAVKTSTLDFERTKRLYDNGLASRRDFEQAKISVESLRLQEAEAAAALNRLDVRISRQSVQIVRAPREGVIVRVNAGDVATFVTTGDLIATTVQRLAREFVNAEISGWRVPGAKASCLDQKNLPQLNMPCTLMMLVTFQLPMH